MDTRCLDIYTSHTKYWGRFPKPHWVYLNNGLNLSDKLYRPIVLWVSFFIKQDRKQEILNALELNLKNPLIDRIVILQENGEIPTSILSNKKIAVIRCSFPWRTKYSDILSYIPNDSADINIIANNDIAISNHGLDLLYALDDRSMVVLSRWEVNYKYFSSFAEAHSAAYLSQNIASSDVWIFYGKPNVVADIYLGIPGCENMFIGDFYDKGYNIVNLGHIIPSYHFHRHQNAGSSYPFTYYLANKYRLVFIDFSRESMPLKSIYSMKYILNSQNSLCDEYRFLSEIFSKFWNFDFKRDDFGANFSTFIETEKKNLKEDIYTLEYPRIKQELINSTQKEVDASLTEYYLERLNEINKEIDKAIDEQKLKIDAGIAEYKCKSKAIADAELSDYATEKKVNVHREALEHSIKAKHIALQEITMSEDLIKGLKDTYASRLNELESTLKQYEDECKGKLHDELSVIKASKIEEINGIIKTTLESFDPIITEKNSRISELQQEIIKLTQTLEEKKKEFPIIISRAREETEATIVEIKKSEGEMIKKLKEGREHLDAELSKIRAARVEEIMNEATKISACLLQDAKNNIQKFQEDERMKISMQIDAEYKKGLDETKLKLIEYHTLGVSKAQEDIKKIYTDELHKSKLLIESEVIELRTKRLAELDALVMIKNGEIGTLTTKLSTL